MSVYKPATREEMTEWCLRKLGAPVVEINIDPIKQKIDLKKHFNITGNFIKMVQRERI